MAKKTIADANEPESWGSPELYRELLRLRCRPKKLELSEIAKRMQFDPRYTTNRLIKATRWLVRENEVLSKSAPREIAKSNIEQKLLKRFEHLKDVFVVPGKAIIKTAQYDAVINRWGLMAATYIDGKGEDAASQGRELHVCMSGGETILEITNQLPIKNRENVFFYASALIGRSHMVEMSHVDAIANATIAWSRSGRNSGGCIYTTVTPYDLSGSGRTYDERRQMVGEELDLLAGTPHINRYLRRDLARVDIALAGVGPVEEPEGKLFRSTQVSATNLLKHTAAITQEDLTMDEAVGEIGYCYFDQEGKDAKGKWRFYLTAGDYSPTKRGIGFYREMVKAKKDVIVCGGPFKEQALTAALKGELFNIWFTSEDAAKTILASC